jgi:hypothetical protein
LHVELRALVLWSLCLSTAAPLHFQPKGAIVVVLFGGYVLLNSWVSRQPAFNRCGLLIGRATGVSPFAPRVEGATIRPDVRYVLAFATLCLVGFGLIMRLMPNGGGLLVGFELVRWGWSEREDFLSWLKVRRAPSP